MANQASANMPFSNNTNSKKKFRFKKNNSQLSELNASLSGSSEFIQEYIVLLSNILTIQLSEVDIELLLNTFLDAHNNPGSKNTHTIDSVQVFKDCLYLIFLSESEALDAVKFFNNYQFKAHRIQANLINTEDLFLDLNSIFEKPKDDLKSEEHSRRFSEVDCEILVTTRQSKFVSFFYMAFNYVGKFL